MTTAYDPLVGQVLDDRYEIVAKLARGGMATVYRARDKRLARIVALKVMRSDLGEDDEFTAKFDREARSAAVLSHPNVVAVFDQGISFGQSYIVMEYVDGETLRRAIGREAPYRPEQALMTMEAIASALAAAHEAGVVHRDIKPENVLISGRGQVKVADFGLARKMDSPQMTSTGVLVGTASYLPPELVTHARPDSRSDVYSAGVVLFELLTGQKPHQGETNYQIAFRHVTVDVDPPSRRLKTTEWRIPDYVDALVLAATARDPENRISDGRELLQLVRRCRAELESNGDADRPAFAAELLPEPSDAQHTVPILPRAADRPRPSGAPLPPSGVSSGSAPSPVPSPLSFRSLEQDEEPAAPLSELPSSPRGTRQPRSAPTPVFAHLQLSDDPTHRRRRGIILLVLVLLITAFATIGTWWWASGRFTAVPDLTNLVQAEASEAAQANALSLTAASEFSETVEAGRVIRTDPAAGQRVSRGSNVTVWISLGQERYDMPTVVGLTVLDATEALRSQSLRTGTVTEEFSDTAPIGQVIAAAYQPGTRLKRDTPVDLTTSKGPKPLEIASYVGREAALAVTEMEAAGFVVTVTEQHSEEVAAGLVISQDPSSGIGARGDTITLVRSLGPVSVTIPSVEELSVEEAQKKLEELGVTVRVENSLGLPVQLGVVRGTDPAAGQQAPSGSEVVLYVW